MEVDANPTSLWGNTPLSYAAGNGHEEAVDLLLRQNGVEINAEDMWGQMPLSFVAQNGHEPVIRLLMAAGALQLPPPMTS